MTGNLLLDGALVLVVIAGLLGIGKLTTFREKALAESEDSKTDPTEAQKIGVQF